MMGALKMRSWYWKSAVTSSPSEEYGSSSSHGIPPISVGPVVPGGVGREPKAKAG